MFAICVTNRSGEATGEGNYELDEISLEEPFDPFLLFPLVSPFLSFGFLQSIKYDTL